jgi:hypothetical protein
MKDPKENNVFIPLLSHLNSTEKYNKFYQLYIDLIISLLKKLNAVFILVFSLETNVCLILENHECGIKVPNCYFQHVYFFILL